MVDALSGVMRWRRRALAGLARASKARRAEATRSGPARQGRVQRNRRTRASKGRGVRGHGPGGARGARHQTRHQVTPWFAPIKSTSDDNHWIWICRRPRRLLPQELPEG